MMDFQDVEANMVVMSLHVKAIPDMLPNARMCQRAPFVNALLAPPLQEMTRCKDTGYLKQEPTVPLH